MLGCNRFGFYETYSDIVEIAKCVVFKLIKNFIVKIVNNLKYMIIKIV